MALASFPAFRLRRTGVLGALCWWFVLSLGVHTLLTVVAFASAAAIGPVAAAYTAITAVSLVVLWRRRRALSPRRRAIAVGLPAMWMALGLVTLALLLPGSNRFDAQMHAAKVVLQQVDGFRLQDPFSPLHVAHSSFHVNVVHVLHGLGAYFTGSSPLDVWRTSGPWFRLVGFGGVQLLAIYVFRSTYLSALAVMAAAAIIGLESDSALPGSIAAHSLLPALLVALDSHAMSASRHALTRLAVCAVVLPALHVGHAVLYLACLLPVLAAVAAVRYWGGARPWTRMGIAALVVTGPTLPFLALTAMYENHALEQMGAELSWERTSVRIAGVSLATISLKIQHWILPATAATGLLLAVHQGARRRFTIGASALLMALQLMFNPIVFGAASMALPFWMMRRVSAFAELAGFLSAAGLAWLCRVELRRPQLRSAVAAVATAVVVAFSTENVINRLQRLELDASVAALGGEVREVLQSLPGRPLVAADAELSLLIPAVRPAAVMAPSRGNTNPADPGLVDRARARDELLHAATTDERRRDVVRRYGVDVLLVRRGSVSAGTAWHGPLIRESAHLLAYAANPAPSGR